MVQRNPFFAMRRFALSETTKAKDDIQGIVRDKLGDLGYFPEYITPEIEQRIRDLQNEELSLRRSKRFTIEDGVRMLKEIDSINLNLAKLAQEYSMKQNGEEMAEARKHKRFKSKPKRRVIVKKKIKSKRRK